MKEVKSPKKPLIYYYVLVLAILFLFNLLVPPILMQPQIDTVDYGTFMDMIEDKTKCNKLLERIYGFYINDGYPPEWDAGARLLKSYDADAKVVDRFSELFESYRQARLNIK